MFGYCNRCKKDVPQHEPEVIYISSTLERSKGKCRFCGNDVVVDIPIEPTVITVEEPIIAPVIAPIEEQPPVKTKKQKKRHKPIEEKPKTSKTRR